MDPGTLIGSPQFVTGLACGAAAAAAVGAWTAVANRRKRDEPSGDHRAERPGGFGVAFVVAVTAAIVAVGPARSGVHLRPVVGAGLALLWLSGFALLRVMRPRPVAATLGALPGALLLASGTAGAPAWALALLVVGTAVAGTATADLDRRFAASGVPALAFLLALGGAYATLPDTELARIALGAAAPLVVLAWPLRIVAIGPGGAAAATGLFLWIAVSDGSGRWSATIGAAACLGVLVVEPVARRLAFREGRVPPGRVLPPVALLGLQVVLVAWGSRVAGLQQAPGPAAVLAATGLAVAGVLVHAVAGRLSTRRGARRRERA